MTSMSVTLAIVDYKALNNWLLKTFNANDWEIESIFVKLEHEKDCNF